ncbi:conserved protein of unknown function [Magnetospirillum gryphiswaldense MSR-1 v2]|uniref:Flagellin N-terminal domain-containing protein n=1 Tax=Magnetospirillum gryphiswaldense (strain DSM 6361 / JCM 21280 / NBRC 15271 / MSR-1) TaxID=431944 RepID=V6EVZ4_MAGGM|nr:hypothetical protein [Magnetospirillum gryphiswaldense]CDK97349.1 conserved protein of unknown function [Magnetospirillum gryphiswaldense MSR-1 v2]
MEAVSRSVGRLDDLYALTQVTGAPFRRFGQVVSNLDAQTSTSQRTYTLAEGRLASQAAVDAAADVLDSLYVIRDKLGIADGLSVPSQRGDASRFSVQTDITTLLGGIDQRVARASVSGLNLVSQPSTAIRIQTTDLGGVSTVTSQPLDSRSLGLSGLSVIDQSATEAARIAVDRAIRQVSTRYEALSNAVQGLRYDDGINSGLVGALSSFGRGDGATSYSASATATSSSSAALRRGSLVNLRA